MCQYYQKVHCSPGLPTKTISKSTGKIVFPTLPLIVACLHVTSYFVDRFHNHSKIGLPVQCSWLCFVHKPSQLSQHSYYHAVTFKEPYQATWVSQDGHSANSLIKSHLFLRLCRLFTFCFPFPGPAGRIPNPKPFPQFPLMSPWQCLMDWTIGPSSSSLPLSTPHYSFVFSYYSPCLLDVGSSMICLGLKDVSSCNAPSLKVFLRLGLPLDVPLPSP